MGQTGVIDFVFRVFNFLFVLKLLNLLTVMIDGATAYNLIYI